MKDMGKAYIRLTVFWFVLLLGVSVVYGTVPERINYQGYLTDNSGNPITTSVSITVNIYTVPAGGTPFWTETHVVVPDNGVYNIVLGSMEPLYLDYNLHDLFYLGVKVGSDAEMTPRQELTSVGASHTAWTALNLNCTGCISQSELDFTPGDITAVTAGTGLGGGGTTGSVTLNADTVYLQRRVSSACPAGQSIRVISQDGTVTCQADTNSGGTITGVTAGNGLSGGGTTGNVSLSANFGGDGAANSVSRSDHSHDAMYQKKYLKVAVVEPYGNGDYTNPATAMADYQNWCGFPSNISPCLLKIMPGFYDVSAGSVVTQPYIDIEGSGENVTIISGTMDNATSGVVMGASNAEIRFLTVENRGGSVHAYAIGLMNFYASPKITNVTASSSGGGSGYGVYNVYSFPTMINVTATASTGYNAYGVSNEYSSPTMINVTASSSGSSYSRGVINDASSPMMINVTASGSGGTDNFGVQNTQYSSPTMINVTATASGITNNYGVSSSYTSSPTMSNVTATASDGTNNYGVYSNNSAVPTMRNVTATVWGGTNNYAIFNDTAASSTMSNVTATASGGSQYNYGIWNGGSSTAKLTSVTSTAWGGVDSFGLLNTNTGGNITVDHSTLSGKRSIRNDNSYANIYVGSSKLDGDVLGSAGTFKCVGVYNASYSAITCP